MIGIVKNNEKDVPLAGLETTCLEPCLTLSDATVEVLGVLDMSFGATMMVVVVVSASVNLKKKKSHGPSYEAV
jgi:hypothetical protein